MATMLKAQCELRILKTVRFCVGVSRHVEGMVVLAVYAGNRTARDWSSHPIQMTPPMGAGTSWRGMATKWNAFCCTPTVRSLMYLRASPRQHQLDTSRTPIGHRLDTRVRHW